MNIPLSVAVRFIGLLPRSTHFDLDQHFQGRKNVRTFFPASGSLGRRWSWVFLTEKKRREPATLGQLIGHEEVVLGNVLHARSREEERVLHSRSRYELED